MILSALEKFQEEAETHYNKKDEMIYLKPPQRAPEGQTGFSNFEDSRGESSFYLVGGAEKR